MTDATTIWKSSSVEDLKPGAQIMIRNGAQAGVESSASRPQGHLADGHREARQQRRRRADPGRRHRGECVAIHEIVQRGTQRLTLDALEPGWEVVVTAPKPPAVDAAQIDVVWAPTASAR